MNLEITSPFYFALPALFVFIFIEYLLTRSQDKEHYSARDSIANVKVGIASLLLLSFTKGKALLIFYWLYEGLAQWRIDFLGYEYLDWKIWWLWVILLICDDFSFYWNHRLSHTIRILWAAHVVHHSSKKFNLSTNIRNGIFTSFYSLLFWLWLAALGFHPVMIITISGVNAIYRFGLHVSKIPKLGSIGKVFNTPELHAVHHARNEEYLNKNHAGIFMFWDRLFGTYKAYDKTVTINFGAIKGPESYRLHEIAFHEFRGIWKDIKSTKVWKHKLMFVFAAPGWHPEGTKTNASRV